ncbi:MAG: peptidylprolyl isomerase [Thiogranum sp.]|nr:peptidylprolyl isomerase [Thiogranum sp.]
MKFRYMILAMGLTGLMSACDQTPEINPPQENSANAATVSEAENTSAVEDTSKVVARVNGAPITEAMLGLYSLQRDARTDSGTGDGAAILEEVINLELARQKGEQKGVDEQLTVALQIEQQRRAVIATAAIKQELEENPVTEEELRKVYDENVSTGEEYKARHILVEEQDKARELIKKLDEGADFSELAKAHSTGPSGKSGGELGWFSSTQMVEPFSEAVAELEKGSYTKEPVETQFGWHVIMLDDSRETTPPDFEMLKPQIASMLQNQRVQQYIAELRDGANIEIIQPVQSAAPAEDGGDDVAESTTTPADDAGTDASIEAE